MILERKYEKGKETDSKIIVETCRGLERCDKSLSL
jgi:hypothetical protein